MDVRLTVTRCVDDEGPVWLFEGEDEAGRVHRFLVSESAGQPILEALLRRDGEAIIVDITEHQLVGVAS
ncbi:MAG TPA: hypothetical protein VFI40_04805 [Nocardioides sp.]|nr:hypothetical protein [Nocardioides sp.]